MHPAVTNFLRAVSLRLPDLPQRALAVWVQDVPVDVETAHILHAAMTARVTNEMRVSAERILHGGLR